MGASSSRVAFRAFGVGAGCSAVVGLLLGLLGDARGVLQMSVSSCWDLSVWGSRFVGAGFRPFCCFWLGCLLRLVLGMDRRGVALVPAVVPPPYDTRPRYPFIPRIQPTRPHPHILRL